MSRLIALLTDFGYSDSYTASMKGVIHTIAPDAIVVDISHAVPPGDISSGAFVLYTCFSDFPTGTVFVVVIDPGVGSDRLPLIVRDKEYVFIGPDNGVLWPCLSDKAQIRAIENRDFQNSAVSTTFHGRDIFAPAGAYYLQGNPFEQFGPSVHSPMQFMWEKPVFTDDSRSITGKIIYIDHFGNLITNIPVADFGRQIGDLSAYRLFAADYGPFPLCEYFSQVSPGSITGISGSTGFLEIACNGGSAREKLSLAVHDPISLTAN